MKKRDKIKFSNNDDLEVLCITPWLIEKVDSEIDILFNSHSFVEMPKNVVENYIKQFLNFSSSNDPAIALTSYENFNLNTAFHPDELPKLFNGKEFINFKTETLLDSSKSNFYYLSSGRFSIN